MKSSIILLLIIFSLSFFIRIFGIGLLPINHDEAGWSRTLLYRAEANPSRNFWFSLVISRWIDRIWSYFSKNTLEKSSLNAFILRFRFPPILIGTLTILLVYLLGKALYGCKAGVISSILLGFLPWHIIQSRITGNLIWIPFFGILIFLCYFNSLKTDKTITKFLWFIFSCVFLAASLKTHESSIVFIPIFLFLIVFNNERAKFKIIALAVFLSLFSLPVYLVTVNHGIFWGHFFRSYHKNIFEGALFINIFKNLGNNFPFAIKQLFFNFDFSSELYAKALKSPLIIHPAIFVILLFSLALAVKKREAADRIMVIWLFLGFFGALAGIDANAFQPRYIFIILPPLIILTARVISMLFSSVKALWICAIILLGWIIQTELLQWGNFYYSAPFHTDNYIKYSFGCKEAADYLATHYDVRDYHIIQDKRMTFDAYLIYFLVNKGYWKDGREGKYLFKKITAIEKPGRKKIILALWAQETHPISYWHGLFSRNYLFFRQKYPDLKPSFTVYYPDGSPAINIFELQP